MFSENRTKNLFIYAIYTLAYLLIYSILSTGKYIHYPPFSIHSWAQADRASIAYCFYQYGYSFFQPHTLNIINGTGITGVEFPIVYYIVSLLYKVFGHSDFIFRLFVLSICYLGYLHLIKIVYKLTSNHIYIILSLLLIFLSPIYLYYSFSFLPDIVALSLTIIGIYNFIEFSEKKRYLNLGLFFICISLSILIKITFAVFTIALIISIFFQLFKSKQQKHLYLIIISGFLSILISSCWYYYSNYLNNTFNSGVFLMSARPPESFEILWNSLSTGSKMWSGDFMNSISLGLLLISIGIVFFYRKKIDSFYFNFMLFSILGTIAYIVLFSTQFVNHDYYQILFYFNFILIVVNLSKCIDLNSISLKTSILISGIAIGLNIYYVAGALSIRNTKNDVYKDRFGDQKLEKLIGFDKKLDELKIPRTARVLFFYDFSMNISLYYLGRPGIPVNYTWENNFVSSLLERKDIDYIIIFNNENIEKEGYVKVHLGEYVYNKDNLKIFKKI